MSQTDLQHRLQQALNDLAAERKRGDALQRQLLHQQGELEVLRGAAFHASTSRLLAEEELDDTRDRLQLALDAAQLALWEWDTRTGDVYLNARWSELMGDVAVDTHTHVQPLLDRIHPDDRAALHQKLDEAISGKVQRYSVQFRIRTPAGEWLWLESHGLVADHDAQGRALRLIGISADIRERRKLQEDSETARHQAELANRAKTEFLANVSHEVRTPLNGVMGLIRLLMDSPLNAEQQHWLTLMDESAHTLLGLLNDILDLSKIEAGKMSLENRPFDPSELVEHTCAPLLAQAGTRQLDLGVELHPGLPPQVLGDSGRLRQVLTNLLSNALKFTPAGGRVALAVSPVAGRGIRFEVSDTGIGIAPEHQARIFEAFTQADASTTRKFGGTGLGLAISAQLVQMMGGHIRLQSAPGQGSSFSFVLPLQAADAPRTDTSPLSAPMELREIESRTHTFAGLHVLVAEDHPVNELLMRQLLQKLGCQTSVARNGLEAIAAWRRGGVDLIMMDVQMPELNGLDATREIRAQERSQHPGSAQPRCGHVPIVAVTANAMSGDREICMAAGMDAYTSKPVSPQALMLAMTQAIEAAQTTPVRVETPPPRRGPPPRPNDGTPPAPAQGQAPPLHLDKLRHRLDGDEQALVQLARAMRTDLAQRVDALATAGQQQDRATAMAQAHALKGSLASMTAQRAAALTNGLEMAARSGEWALFSRALPVLRGELDKLDAALAALLPPATP